MDPMRPNSLTGRAIGYAPRVPEPAKLKPNRDKPQSRTPIRATRTQGPQSGWRGRERARRRRKAEAAAHGGERGPDGHKSPPSKAEQARQAGRRNA